MKRIGSTGTAEKAYCDFSLYRASDTGDLRTLKELLYASQKGRKDPGEWIFRHMFGGQESTCRSVILEENYLDEDHLDGFSRFYYLFHSEVSKYCKRLHMFSCDIEETDIFHLEEEHRRNYLGFVVIRPTPINAIGQTVLRPYGKSDGVVTCAASYPVDLAGNCLTACGSVFVQQDAGVAACASAAVYVAVRYMATKFGTRYCSTSEISAIAAERDTHLGRGIPSRGLTPSQIGKVLNYLGYDVLIWGSDRNKPQNLRDEISWAIESEIPVVITCDLSRGRAHALTIVGHGWNTKNGFRQRESGNYLATSSLTDEYIVQDDRKGPYRQICFKDETSLEFKMTGSNEEPEGTINSVIIPLPKGVSMTGGQAERKANAIIEAAFDKVPGSWHLSEEGRKDIVLRTYLRLSSELKRDADDKNAMIPERVRFRLRGIRMPKYVWVTEVTTTELAKQRLKIGDIVLDAFGSPWTTDFLVMYLIGRVAEEGFLEVETIGSETSSLKELSYPMFVRHSISEYWTASVAA